MESAKKAPDDELKQPLKAKPGFQKGHQRFGGRKKGVHNKIPRTMREAMLKAADIIGRDYATSKKQDELVALFVQHGRQNLAAFTSHLVSTNVPRATAQELDSINNNNTSSGGGGPPVINIISIPTGQHFDRISGELLDVNNNPVGMRLDDSGKLIITEGLPLDTRSYQSPPVPDNVVALRVVDESATQPDVRGDSEFPAA